MKKNNRARFGAFLTAIFMMFSASGCRPADPEKHNKKDETNKEKWMKYRYSTYISPYFK